MGLDLLLVLGNLCIGRGLGGGVSSSPSFSLILYSALSAGCSLDLALFYNRDVTSVPFLADLQSGCVPPGPHSTATQKTCSLSWETIFQNMVAS